MATFPAVGDIERDDALARLDRRHREYGDSRWSEAGDQPREVLDYLAAHRQRLPAKLAHDDAWDELVLTAWVHWDDRRREAAVLYHAIRRGLSLREVGRFVGVHTAQGTRDYLDSLDARLHEYHRRTRENHPDRDRSSPAASGPELLVDPAGPAGDATSGKLARGLSDGVATPTCATRGVPGRSGAPTGSSPATDAPPNEPARPGNAGWTTTTTRSPPSSSTCLRRPNDSGWRSSPNRRQYSGTTWPGSATTLPTVVADYRTPLPYRRLPLPSGGCRAAGGPSTLPAPGRSPLVERPRLAARGVRAPRPVTRTGSWRPFRSGSHKPSSLAPVASRLASRTPAR